MTVWGLFGVTLSSAGLFASILGAFLTYAARKNGEATRQLIRTMEERLTTLLGEMQRGAEQRQHEVLQLFDRIDRRMAGSGP